MPTRRWAVGGLAAATLAAVARGSARAEGRRSPPSEWLSIEEAARALRLRRFSSEDLVTACLDRIRALDSRLHAFISVAPEQAIDAARRADDELRRGVDRGPLQGIPIAVKDNIDTAKLRTTAASAAFADRVPASDAVAVARLRDAGAVLLGKLNMHELAGGTTSAVSAFGAVRNPWDESRVAGGSSGGSAAAVAAGLCIASVGTDTGGSIRVPAACCGVVGFKPTFGVVSTQGVMLLSEEFDHVGPLCGTVADAALMLRAMTDHPVAAECDPARLPSVHGLRVGVLPPAVCGRAPASDVDRAFRRALDVIRALVASLGPAELPVPEQLGRIIDAEAWSRYSAIARERPGAFDARTRETFGLDGPAPDVDLQDLRAQLSTHRAAVRAAFGSVDLVVTPTVPTAAIRLADAREPFAQSDCTFPFSLAGVPSISVPCGSTDDRMPVGLQISGPPLADATVLALARAFESRTPWHRQHPIIRPRRAG